MDDVCLMVNLHIHCADAALAGSAETTVELQCRLLENRAVCFLFMEALRLDVILHKDANMADCDYFLLE